MPAQSGPVAWGQYGNSKRDISSIFIPARVPVNQALVTDLNTSAYLDFYAPGILKTYPSLLAVYIVDTQGVIRYYPNIGLAYNPKIPSDFNATKQSYYALTKPLFNEQRVPRWTRPYEDLTGGGLIVTVAAPVYSGDQFIGIAAANMGLDQITDQVRAIQVGQTGYAFIIDKEGCVISMPQRTGPFDVRLRISEVLRIIANEVF
jgi:hypothetical protein